MASEGVSSFLTGGGIVSFIWVLGWVVNTLIIQPKRERRQDDREDRNDQVQDTATVTALTMKSLQAERDHNAKIQARLDDLERENDHLKNELFEQKRKYETEVSELKAHAQSLQTQINDLVAQLARLSPPDGTVHA